MAEGVQEMRNIISFLAKEIDFQNRLLEESEKAWEERDKLQQQIDVKNQMLEQMQNRCNELSTTLNKAVDEKDGLGQLYAEEMRKMKSDSYDQPLNLYQENEKLKDHVDCLRKELEEQAKDIERHEDKIKLQKHFVTFARKQLKSELDTMQEKTDEVEFWKDQSTVLMVMQRKSNDELQEAHTALLNGFQEFLSSDRGKRRTIGIKRMGELDGGPFRDACSKKFRHEELDGKSSELCSFWQEQIQKPEWHPFKVTSADDNSTQEIDEKDEKLRTLKHEWGAKVHDVVTRALLEMIEYNPSGTYPVRELWNFKEERKASLKEIVVYILSQLRSLKGKGSKRRRR